MNYTDYTYKGLTPSKEGDLIGYALIKPGYVNEDLSEVDPVCLHCSLNAYPLVDFAKLKFKEGEFIISKILFSEQGNYLGDDQVFLSVVPFEKIPQIWKDQYAKGKGYESWEDLSDNNSIAWTVSYMGSVESDYYNAQLSKI